MAGYHESFRWRTVVASGELDNDMEPGPNSGRTVTILDRVASNRRMVLEIGRPTFFEFDVPSWHPSVNLPWNDAYDEAELSEGTRLLYVFRDERLRGADPEWVCRGAFIIMQVEDVGDEDDSRTHVIAYDPRQLLYARKAMNPETGGNIGALGYTYVGERAGRIAYDVLRLALETQGSARIVNELTNVQAGTEFIDEFTIQQGMSVGEVWDELEATGKVEVYLDPIYQPVTRPGMLAVAHYYGEMGSDNPGAIFGWDSPSRSLVGVSHMLDGTQRANHIRFGVGMGGAVPAVVKDLQSRTKYGEYWSQQWFPVQKKGKATIALAQGALDSQSHGRRTVTISPTAERAPIPLLDYELGDRVQVAWTNELRQILSPTESYSRITSIPIEISDDQLEEVGRAVVEPLVVVFPEITLLGVHFVQDMTGAGAGTTSQFNPTTSFLNPPPPGTVA